MLIELHSLPCRHGFRGGVQAVPVPSRARQLLLDPRQPRASAPRHRGAQDEAHTGEFEKLMGYGASGLRSEGLKG